MKRKLFRIENLLLLIPFLGMVPELYEMWASYYGQNLYEFYVIGGGSSGVLYYLMLFITPMLRVFSVILPLYMMHYFLRAIGRGDKRICIIHVLTTFVFSLYTLNYAVAYSVVPGWHTTLYPSGFLGTAPFWVNVLFWLMQVAFIIYGFMVIHRWRKSPA